MARALGPPCFVEKWLSPSPPTCKREGLMRVNELLKAQWESRGFQRTEDPSDKKRYSKLFEAGPDWGAWLEFILDSLRRRQR